MCAGPKEGRRGGKGDNGSAARASSEGVIGKKWIDDIGSPEVIGVRRRREGPRPLHWQHKRNVAQWIDFDDGDTVVVATGLYQKSLRPPSSCRSEPASSELLSGSGTGFLVGVLERVNAAPGLVSTWYNRHIQPIGVGTERMSVNG